MNKLVFAIAFPIIALLCLMLYKQNIINTGQVISLPIVGFDPRDLLSGHYLQYNVDYQAENSCDDDNDTAQLCLEPYRRFFNSSEVQNGCQLYLTGSCRGGRFKSGLERFYIPEEYADQLDKLVQEARGELVISVNSRGTAVIKYLLIDGVPWMDKVQN